MTRDKLMERCLSWMADGPGDGTEHGILELAVISGVPLAVAVLAINPHVAAPPGALDAIGHWASGLPGAVGP